MLFYILQFTIPVFSLQFPGREVNCGNHTAESCSDCNWVKQEKSRLMVKNHNNQNTSNAQHTYFRWAKNGAVVNVNGGPIIVRKFDQLSTSSCLLLLRKIYILKKDILRGRMICNHCFPRRNPRRPRGIKSAPSRQMLDLGSGTTLVSNFSPFLSCFLSELGMRPASALVCLSTLL